MYRFFIKPDEKPNGVEHCKRSAPSAISASLAVSLLCPQECNAVLLPHRIFKPLWVCQSVHQCRQTKPPVSFGTGLFLSEELVASGGIWLILPVVICLFQGLSHANARVPAFRRGEVCVRLIKRFIVYPTKKGFVHFRWDNDLEMNR